MEKLVELAISKYKLALQEDEHNTDSLFFILEDIGMENDMDELEYAEFENEVYSVTNELGI